MTIVQFSLDEVPRIGKFIMTESRPEAIRPERRGGWGHTV
jgi:hypothetical protein